MSDQRYNGRVRGRLTASLVALVILATGVIPALPGYRCVATGLRMKAPATCCHHQSVAATLKEQCCEAVAAARVEPRRAPPSTDNRIAPPIFIGLITFPPTLSLLSAPELATSARARGKPPGDALHLLSTILRV